MSRIIEQIERALDQHYQQTGTYANVIYMGRAEYKQWADGGGSSYYLGRQVVQVGLSSYLGVEHKPAEELSEIIQKIHRALNDFRNDTGHDATEIYLGWEEWDQLCRHVWKWRPTARREQIEKFFQGHRVYQLVTASHLGVGIIRNP